MTRVLIILIIFNFIPVSQAQWIKQCCDTSEYIRSIYFIDNNTGWAAGDNGKLYKTTNKGNDWVLLKNNPYYTINGSIYFINAFTGWLCDNADYSYGIIRKTTNGGYNWNVIYYNFDKYLFYSLHFFDADTGFVLSVNNTSGWSILKTTNSGLNWEEKFQGHFLSSIYTLNKDTIWVSGGFSPGRILKTTNGGVTWITNYVQGSDQLHSVYFINKDLGWTTGFGIRYVGVILNTTDGGVTWFKQDSIYNNTPYTVQFTDVNTGYVSGVGFISKTTNGGRKWAIENLDITIYSHFFVTNDFGWIAGGSILMTTSGGGQFTFKPEIFNLLQNYPNPFNGTTIIKFEIPEEHNVYSRKCSIVLYDITGKKVKTLFDGYKLPGIYSIEFNSVNISSGVYFYRLEVNSSKSSGFDYTETKKMVLVR